MIFFDYLYIVLSFIFDPQLTEIYPEIKWFVLTGVVVFYLINLLRYSKECSIYAGILSIIVFISICIFYNTDISDIFSMNLALIIILYIGYSVTTSNKKMLVESNAKTLMERYLPTQLVNELYKDNISLDPGGKNQEVTILFSDIRSFTSISEKMKASDVVRYLNEYLSTMTDVIFKNKGTIDKFIGDAIMTIFGAPLKSKDDALRAVETAIDMNRALDVFNIENSNINENLSIGIGIHTGDVIVGNIGSKKRIDYTVIGDSVNLSSRIEGLTQYYQCPILISESTYDRVIKKYNDNNFCFRDVDRVIVKGKKQCVQIYEVIYFDDNNDKKNKLLLKNNFEKALEFYRQKKFQLAIDCFTLIENDNLSKIYIKRCKEYLINPPDDSWSGVFIMKTK